MNREQRRKMAKDMGMGPNDRIELNSILVTFTNGKAMYLDIGMVQLIDRESGKPLFEAVLDAIPAGIAADPTATQPAATTPAEEFPDDDAQQYSVEFDTPEGKMRFTKKGNWSGVQPVLES